MNQFFFLYSSEGLCRQKHKWDWITSQCKGGCNRRLSIKSSKWPYSKRINCILFILNFLKVFILIPASFCIFHTMNSTLSHSSLTLRFNYSTVQYRSPMLQFDNQLWVASTVEFGPSGVRGQIRIAFRVARCRPARRNHLAKCWLERSHFDIFMIGVDSICRILVEMAPRDTLLVLSYL